MIIDAHQHFWKLDDSRFDYSWMDAPELEPIRRDRMPSDLKPMIDEVGVQQSIVVQTQHNLEENRWALQLAEQNDWIVGVVGWVDLASQDCEQQLLEFKDHPKFVGIRHVTQDEPDDNFIVRDDVIRGLKVLEKHRVPFDLLFYVKHLRHAKILAEKLPGLPMVIDHLAKPEIKDQRTDNWIDNFKVAAEYPNVYCKLSGMVTEADWKTWKPDDLRPYVKVALDHFGPQRCMIGSDWPVCELAGTYREVFGGLTSVLESLSEGDREQIFGRTAAEFYGV